MTHVQNDKKKRRAHSYSKLSPRKPQPRSRSSSNDRTYTCVSRSQKTGDAGDCSKDECDQNGWAWSRQADSPDICSPKSIYLTMPKLSKLGSRDSSKYRQVTSYSKDIKESFGRGFKGRRASSPNDNIEKTDNKTSDLERYVVTSPSSEIENESDTDLDMRSRYSVNGSNNSLTVHHQSGCSSPFSPKSDSRTSRCFHKDKGHVLALFDTDIYRIGKIKHDNTIQGNKNTNSGVTATRKAKPKKTKSNHKFHRSQSTSPCSVKSNLSWDDNDTCSNYSCTFARGKNKSHSRASKVGAKASQLPNKNHAPETKQFWEKMTSKLKPNDIAIGITSSRKGRTASKTRLDALEEIPSDTNSHACVCRNNSKGNCSVDSTSSRRCRSMGPRPASKGFVSPRGISVGASSSDESSHRYHRQQPKNKSPAGGRGAKAGPAAKGKNSRPTSAPSKPKGKSPVGKPSPILKLKPKGAATPQSTPSGGSVADSKGKGKKSKSASASASASAKGLNVQGIVPLTPAEICARCNKYRIDQEQSECVPLDFSHVQQLESLAQSVNEESTRTLLYTVASIIEEKVCRQMFRCLLPCTCPGCKNRPNICQSLDKFLGGNSSSKGKRKAGAGEKSGGGKGGKKKSKASPNEDQKKKESGSPKKKKGKAEKSAGDGEKATGGKGGNDECVSPEGCTMPCKPTCYYDRDCCGSGGGWSNSSMRLGWWPGNRVRFPCYDRCWSNRSYDGTSRLSGLTDNLLPKDEMNRTNDDVGSNGNAACYQRRIEATNTSHSNIGFTDKLNGRWASSSYASHSIRPVSDIFRRYSTDPSNPCPHDGIQPRENKDLASLSLYSDPSKIRDHIMGDLPEKPRSTWGPKLIYGDEDSARLLETFERNFTLDLEKTKANENSQEADSKVASPSNKESVSGTVHKRRFSPKKRTKKKPVTSRSSSPTTRAVGEIEERTKALLCDAKLEICQENGVSISKSGQSSQECADNTSLIREFSPIQPPDVNTAYFTSQISQPINNECGTPHVSRSASVEKQWWEGLPEKTSRTFNSVMLKKYSSSSAMPVSVEAIGTSQRAGLSATGGTNPGTIPGLHGRSRSEPRLTQTGGTGTSDATSGRKPWNNTRPGQSADGRPDSARKTGSFTVCKGRPGKQTPKGKPTKKLWKY